DASSGADVGAGLVAGLHEAAFLPGGRRVVECGDAGAWIVDLTTGRRTDLAAPPGVTFGKALNELALFEGGPAGRSPLAGGGRVVCAAERGALVVWDAETGALLRTLSEQGRPLRVSSDGARALVRGDRFDEARIVRLDAEGGSVRIVHAADAP